MLETVKKFAEIASNENFAEYYQRYVMHIQDQIIDQEVQDMSHRILSRKSLNIADASVSALLSQITTEMMR